MTYQRKVQPIDNAILDNLRDLEKFHDHLGQQKSYHDYLVFLMSEIDKQGCEAVINEYCFKGDERAEDMLVHLHAGQPHSLRL